MRGKVYSDIGGGTLHIHGRGAASLWIEAGRGDGAVRELALSNVLGERAAADVAATDEQQILARFCRTENLRNDSRMCSAHEAARVKAPAYLVNCCREFRDDKGTDQTKRDAEIAKVEVIPTLAEDNRAKKLQGRRESRTDEQLWVAAIGAEVCDLPVEVASEIAGVVADSVGSLGRKRISCGQCK